MLCRSLMALKGVLAALMVQGCGASSSQAVQPSGPGPESSISSSQARVDPDHDGLVGETDSCPCRPEDLDGFEDDDGCPDDDNDRDRIADACDLCPDQTETFNGYEDLDGCPEGAQEVMGRNSLVIQIPELVYFDAHQSTLREASLQPIEVWARIMLDHPALKLVEVQGHSNPGEKAQLQLSSRRAAAVRQALIERGVPPYRLVARGYGATRPMVPGEGARNRRVELHILGWTGERRVLSPKNPCPNGPPPPSPSAC